MEFEIGRAGAARLRARRLVAWPRARLPKRYFEGVSDRLALAFRLINLSALPIGASLAAIPPTALDIVYGRSYVSESLTMSILSLSSVLVAQGALLVTTLQAIGHTRQYLAVTFASRSEEHTSELQSHHDLVCRLLLEKKKNNK